VPEIENVVAKRERLRPLATDRPPPTCRLCGGHDFDLFIHLDEVAPSVQFIAVSADEPLPEPVPMSVWQCTHCHLVQHDGGYPDAYYDSYFVSYRTSGLAQSYQGDLARAFVTEHELQGKLVAEVGCGDGIFLSALRDAGADVVGFERSHRAAEILRLDGFTVFEDPIGTAVGSLPEPLAGAVTRHVLEHVDDVDNFLGELRRAVTPGGVVLVEVPALEQTIEGQRAYDFIPEHVSYFTTGTLASAMERAGFWSINVRRIVDGEFLVATGVAPNDPVPPNEWRGKAAVGVTAFLADQAAAGRTVALWGAGPKCLGLVSEIGGRGIRYVVDSDPLKNGRYTPTPRLPILSPEQFMADRVDVVVITVWTYREEIAHQLAELGYEGAVMWLGPGGVTAADVTA
jgi:SAM-dependent methyltransferase